MNALFIKGRLDFASKAVLFKREAFFFKIGRGFFKIVSRFSIAATIFFK